MYQTRSIQSSLSFKDKLFSIDYVLIVSILILGVVSMFAMYSTDGGEFKYHTKSHILRFSVFFLMFFILSFIQIRFWHSTSYIIYFCFFYFISWSEIFWTNFIRFSALVKFLFYEFTTIRTYEVGLILFLAKYYHRISIENINKLRYLFVPIVALIAPVLLVVMQPDLRNFSINCCWRTSSCVVSWGKSQIFCLCIFTFISLLPVAISFLKPYQKTRILTFFESR